MLVSCLDIRSIQVTYLYLRKADMRSKINICTLTKYSKLLRDFLTIYLRFEEDILSPFIHLQYYR